LTPDLCRLPCRQPDVVE